MAVIPQLVIVYIYFVVNVGVVRPQEIDHRFFLSQILSEYGINGSISYEGPSVALEGQYKTSDYLKGNERTTEESVIKSSLPKHPQPFATTTNRVLVFKPTSTEGNIQQIKTEPTKTQQNLFSPQSEVTKLLYTEKTKTTTVLQVETTPATELIKHSEFEQKKDDIVVISTTENETERDTIDGTAKMTFSPEINTYTLPVTSETTVGSESPSPLVTNFSTANTDLVENETALTFTEEMTSESDAEHFGWSTTEIDESSTISNIENDNIELYSADSYSSTTNLNVVEPVNKEQITTPILEEYYKDTSTTEEATLVQFTTEVSNTELIKDTTISVTENETATPVSEETRVKKNDVEQINVRNIETTTNISLTPTTPVSTCPVCSVTTCPVCEPPRPTIPTTSLSMTTKTISADNECRTNQCYVMASQMLSLMNATADPCEDFYSFACGGLLNNPILLEEDLSIDVFNRIKRVAKNVTSSSPVSHIKFKNFYDGCVSYDKLVTEEERKTHGREVLDTIGPFGTLSTESYDVTGLVNMLFHLGCAPFFDVQFDVHSANASLFQVVISPSDINHFKFSFSSHFVSHEEQRQHCLKNDIDIELSTAFGNYQDCMANFTSFIETTIEALSFFRVFDNVSVEEATQLTNEIRETVKYILDTLKELLHPQITQQDIQNKNFKTMSISELHEAILMIDWATLFRGAVENDEDVYNLFVQIYSMEYIREVFDRLVEITPRRTFNALLAIFAHDLYTDIVLTRHWSDREHYCIKVASSLMPVVASNLYLSTFPMDTEMKVRNQTHEVFEQLRASMKNKIALAEWLDKKTLQTVNEKLEFMTIELPTVFNEHFLNSSLEECPLDSKTYIKDSICLLRQFQKQLYQRFHMDPHSTEAMWSHFLTAFSTKTAFIYNLNMFMVPFAVLPSLYDEQMPKHVVMARLGNLLARGIGHNFDSTGVKFSAGGRMGMILAESANPSYDRAVYDINMRYDYPKYHEEEGFDYMYILSAVTMLTLDERLSDLTAADLALSSIPERDFILPWVPFSPRQVYFLAIAQTFCTKKKVPETFTHLYEGTSLPQFERVNTLVSNSEPFSEAFKCFVGSHMNNMVKPSPFPMFKKEDYDTLTTF